MNYQISGNAINIPPDPPGCIFNFTFTWELTDDELVFSNPYLDGLPNLVLEVVNCKPWTKID